jgi:chromosome segregation ATPase
MKPTSATQSRPSVDAREEPKETDYTARLNLLETGLTDVKGSLREMSGQIGSLMGYTMENRVEVQFIRGLTESTARHVHHLEQDRASIVELRQKYDRDMAAVRAEEAPLTSRASFSGMTDTGKYNAVTEEQLKRAMAEDRIRDLERDLVESKAAAKEVSAKAERSRSFWVKTVVGAVITVFTGVVVVMLAQRLSRPATSVTVESKNPPPALSSTK